MHHIAVHKDAEALHEIFQLAHVAGPLVGHEDAAHLRVQRQRRAFLLEAEAIKKETRQQQHVAASFPQGRQMQRNDVQAIEQILAKTPGSHFRFQIAVGRRHDAHVHFLADIAAHTLKFPFLQHPQNLDLQTQIHFPDFVQENGSSVRQLKTSGPGAQRVGKSALFMPEEFAFQQLLGNGPAVDGHKRLVGTATIVMQGPYQQFLARTGFPGDQHRAVGRRHFGQHFKDIGQCGTLPDNTARIELHDATPC